MAARPYAMIGATIAAAAAIIAFSLSITAYFPNPMAVSLPQWIEGKTMPTPRTEEIAGAVLDGKIYMIGGFYGLGKAVSTVEVYDSKSD